MQNYGDSPSTNTSANAEEEEDDDDEVNLFFKGVPRIFASASNKTTCNNNFLLVFLA